MASNADIFGYTRSPKPSSAFSTDGSVLTMASVGSNSPSVEGMLVQNWNINYSQQVQEVFELGSKLLYWVKGRPQGQGQLARVIGTKSADIGTGASLFPPEAFDVCKGGAKFDFTVKSGNCGDVSGTGMQNTVKQVKLEMDGVIVTSIGFSADVNDTRVMENIQWRFGYLKAG